MILNVARFEVKEGMEAAFIEATKKGIEESRKESGNISYVLHTQVENPLCFTFVEEWESTEATEFHRQTAHFGEMMKSIKELCTKPIDISVYEAQRIR